MLYVEGLWVGSIWETFRHSMDQEVFLLMMLGDGKGYKLDVTFSSWKLQRRLDCLQ